DRNAKQLIAKVEQRFRPHAIDRGGAPKSDPITNDVQAAVRTEWPGLHTEVRRIVRMLRAQSLSRAQKDLTALCRKHLGRALTAKLVRKWIDKRASLLAQPRQLTDEILAKKHHCSSRAVKAITTSLKR